MRVMVEVAFPELSFLWAVTVDDYITTFKSLVTTARNVAYNHV